MQINEKVIVKFKTTSENIQINRWMYVYSYLFLIIFKKGICCIYICLYFINLWNLLKILLKQLF